MEAGEYELSAVTPDTNVYASLSPVDGQTTNLSTLTANPHRGTITAGRYWMTVGAANGKTVDATITPMLTRIE